MFEKEAEEYLKKDGTKAEQILNLMQGKIKVTIKQIPFILAAFQQIFIDAATFGYNKANEWHYVKDGDLPKENEYIMIYSKLADNIAIGKRRCAGKIRKRCVYEWYFATYDGTYCLRDKDIIAWKEIILPKEVKNG